MAVVNVVVIDRDTIDRVLDREKLFDSMDRGMIGV